VTDRRADRIEETNSWEFVVAHLSFLRTAAHAPRHVVVRMSSFAIPLTGNMDFFSFRGGLPNP